MKGGVNNTGYSCLSSEIASPDLLSTAALLRPSEFQTTLAAPYDATNKVLTFTNPEFPEGPFRYANVAAEFTIKIPTTTGFPVFVQGYKTHKSPIFNVRFSDDNLQAAFDAADKSSWVTGKIVDVGSATWSNLSTDPANHPILPLHIRKDGIPSGYPAGLRPGQAIYTVVSQSSTVPLPGGIWLTSAEGTGQVIVEAHHWDVGTKYTTINFTKGVPDGPSTTIGGVVYAQVNMYAGEIGMINWHLAKSDPNDPLYLGRLVLPGNWPSDGSANAGKSFAQIYAENRGDPYFFLHHPDFIADRARFSHLRELDTQQTIINNTQYYSGLQRVADRNPPRAKLGLISGHAFGVAESGGGVPWEILFQLANQSKVDLFWPISHVASDEVVLAAGTMFRDTVDRNLRFMPAHSCEVWNFYYAEWPACNVWGAANFGRCAIQSVTFDPATGKATVTKPGHGFQNGQTIRLVGTGDTYDGSYPISEVTPNTFRYTPSGKPAQSSAQPVRQWEQPQAWVTGSNGTVQITGLRWVFGYGLYGDPGLNSGLEITTAQPGQLLHDHVIALSGCSVPEVNGIYRAIRNDYMPANVAFLRFDSQGIHKPTMAPSVNPVAFTARPGETMEAAVLAVGTVNLSNPPGMISIGEANARWHGHRTAQIHRLLYDNVFHEQLDRFVPIIDGFIAGAGNGGFNQTVMDQYVKTLGGQLLPCCQPVFTIANYFSDYEEPQRALYVGDKKRIDSAVAGNGVVSVSCGFDPPDESQLGNVTQNHGWNSGDLVTHFSAGDSRLCGRFTITVTGPTTYTYPQPAGVPDGPVGTAPGASLFAVRNNQIGGEVVGFTRSGEQLTFKIPGHPFSDGQAICFDGFDTPLFCGVFTIQSHTADTVTVTVPGAYYDPQFTYLARAWAFVASVAEHVGEGNDAALDVEWRMTDLRNCASLCEKYGMLPGLYEFGIDGVAFGHVKDVGWILAVMKQGQRTASMGKAIRKSIDIHAGVGFDHLSYFNLGGAWTSYGCWGLKNSQDDTTSAKWPALLERYAAYQTPKRNLGPAQRFRIHPPAPRKIIDPPAVGYLEPLGILANPVTYTLSCDGPGIISPTTLTWPAGSSTPKSFQFTTSVGGPQRITATPSASPGGVFSIMSETYDINNNPGNATVVFQDNFNRADGPVGPMWTSVPDGKSVVLGNTLKLIDDYPKAIAYAVMPAALNSQIEVLLLPAKDGSSVAHDIHIRADPTTGVAYVARVEGQTTHVGFSLHRGLNDDVYLAAAPYQGAYDSTQTYRFVCKCVGTPARMIGWLVNTATGVRLAEWDFVIPATGLTSTQAVDPITQPGVFGLGGYTEPLYEDVIISRLDYAGGIALTGPDRMTTTSSADFTVAPVGGPVLLETTVNLDDGNAGGSFSPASVKFKSLDPQSQLVTYTPANPGTVTLTATASPALGNPSQTKVLVSNTPASANTYSLTLDTTAPVVGSPVVVTATLVGGAPLSADLVVTLACPGAAFDAPITIAAGSASGTCRMTPTTPGSATITPTHQGAGAITDPAPLTVTFGAAPRRPATGYAVILPSSVVVGQAALAVVVLTGGSDLDSNLTVLLSDPNGTFSGPVRIAVGQTFGTTTYTANAAGTHMVSALHAGGNSAMTDPSPMSVTANAPVGTGLTLQQVQAACVAAIQATPVTVATHNDKSGYALTAAERTAIDATLVSSHGSGQWTPADPLATRVANNAYGPGTAGALIASIGAIPTSDVIASTVAATPVAIKSGSITQATFAPGASVPLPSTPPSGYGGGTSLTTAQVQAACTSAINATPVTVGKNGDKTGYALASNGLDAVLIEGNLNARQAMSLVLAASAGVISGSGTGVITIKGANTTATRIVAATDNAGNRSSIQLTLPN